LGCIVVAGLLTKLGKNHASNPAHRRMRRGKKYMRKKGRLMPAYAPCVGQTSASRQQHGRRKKEKNMSATGIEPMTNHLRDREVTILLLGC
jgi:hypothetical protein